MSTDRLAELTSAVRSVYQANEPASFWALEPYFRAFIQAPGLATYINAQLDHLRDQGVTAPELGLAGGTRFTVGGLDPCLLRLDLVTGASSTGRVVHSPASHRLLGLVAGPPLTYRRYEQPRPDPVDQIDRGRLLRRHSDGTLGYGQVLSQRASRDIIEMVPNGSTSNSAVLATLQSPSVTPVLWEYDADTLAPIKLIACDTGSTRLSYIAMLLSEMGASDSLPQLTRLARHRNYTVRWAAIKGIARLDASAGLRLLRAAADDAHPEIRTAARRALAANDTTR